MENALRQIFENNFGYLARWNTTSANHVPMAAAAMYLMKEKTQFSSEKLITDAHSYTSQLSPRRKNDSFVKLSNLPWSVQQKLLGSDDLQESWHVFFQSEFESNIEQAIVIWLERLGLGFSAAACHSIIRIHYAIAVRNVLTTSIFKEELAIAFSDLASRHFPMTEESNTVKLNTLENYLEDHLPFDEGVSELVKNGTLIEDKLMILKTTSHYQEVVNNIAISFDFERCLRKLASMVKKSPDFMLLHAITSGQALLELIRWYPYLDNSSLRVGYRDFVVATVISSHLSNSELVEKTDTKVGDIYERTRLLENDHAQKASYSLTKLYENYSHPEFVNAAKHYQEAYR